MSRDESTDDLRPYQPHPDGLTKPFWDGAAEGRLMLSRCPQCRRWQHPPLDLCRFCAVPLCVEQAPMSGTIYSFTVTHHDAIPLYAPPFVVAVVEVGDGDDPPRIVVRLVDCRPEDVRVGAAVSLETRNLPGGSFKVPVGLLATPRSA
jgi:uncharacterized OB-fold protein